MANLDGSLELLAFGNFLRQIELNGGQWRPEILESSEVDWISYHSAQNDSNLFATAKALANYGEDFYHGVEQELEAMTRVWQNIRHGQVREPPVDRQMLESFVNSFYVISRRANFSLDHLPERLTLGRHFPGRPKPIIPTDREEESSDGESTEKARSPSVVIVPSDIGESEESSLDDYESDFHDCGNDTFLGPDRPMAGNFSVHDYESSDESGDESEHSENESPKETATRKRRNSDDLIEDICKRPRLEYILND